MMIDPSVVARKRTRSRGLVVRRVALSMLGFAVVGTTVLVRDLEQGRAANAERQSAAMTAHDGPLWSDKVMVVTGERIGG